MTNEKPSIGSKKEQKLTRKPRPHVPSNSSAATNHTPAPATMPSRRECADSQAGSSSVSATTGTCGASNQRLIAQRRRQPGQPHKQLTAATKFLFGGTFFRGHFQHKQQKQEKNKKKQQQQQQQERDQTNGASLEPPNEGLSGNNLQNIGAFASDDLWRREQSDDSDEHDQLKNSNLSQSAETTPGRTKSEDEESEETRKARESAMQMKRQFIYYQGKIKTVLVQLWPDANRIPLHERHRLQEPMRQHYGILSQRARLLKDFESTRRLRREKVEIPLLPRRMQEEAKVRLLAWYRPLLLPLPILPGDGFPNTGNTGNADNASLLPC